MKIKVLPDNRCPEPAAPYACAGGMTSRRRPPTRMPGIPSCQPSDQPPQGELDGLAAIPGAVELLTGVVLDPDVVHGHRSARHRLRAVADHQVLDDQVLSVRGRPEIQPRV